MLRFVAWAEKGSFPVTGGTLDQTVFFMSVYDFVTAEIAAIKAETGWMEF